METFAHKRKYFDCLQRACLRHIRLLSGHHEMRCSLPTKILPRVIITYGACARGGGRRPGFEAIAVEVEINAPGRLAPSQYRIFYLKAHHRSQKGIYRHMNFLQLSNDKIHYVLPVLNHSFCKKVDFLAAKN